MGRQTPMIGELQAAMTEAQEIQALIECSPMREQWEPRIQELCAHIDEAYEALTATLEHEAFAARIHELSILLQDIKQLLTK